MQENNDLKILGAKLKALRKSKKLTLEALCYKNGLEPSTISRIEKAITDPKYTTLKKLVHALEANLDEIFN